MEEGLVREPKQGVGCLFISTFGAFLLYVILNQPAQLPSYAQPDQGVSSNPITQVTPDIASTPLPSAVVPVTAISSGQVNENRIPNSGNYTVVKDDTLFNIAGRYGLTANILAAANHLENPNVIKVGQILIIPESTVPTLPPTHFEGTSTDWYRNPQSADINQTPLPSTTPEPMASATPERNPTVIPSPTTNPLYERSLLDSVQNLTTKIGTGIDNLSQMAAAGDRKWQNFLSFFEAFGPVMPFVSIPLVGMVASLLTIFGWNIAAEHEKRKKLEESEE